MQGQHTSELGSLNIGALILGMGFWGMLDYDYDKDPPPKKKKKKNRKVV